MLQHGKLIYRGKVGNKDRGAVDVYLSGTWVILVDPTKDKVVTLYKIDFNVGEDFNKQYIDRVLKRMDENTKKLEEKRNQIATQRNDYLSIVQENEAQIAEYRAAIKKLEKLNEDYRAVVNEMDIECGLCEMAVRIDVEALMRR